MTDNPNNFTKAQVNGDMVFSNGEENLSKLQGEDMFRAFSQPGKNYMTSKEFWQQLAQVGISPHDPRLRECVDLIAQIPNGTDLNPRVQQIDKDAFTRLITQSTLVRRALLRELVVPDFKSFTQNITKIFDDTKELKGGKVADYIPQLARINPDYYAVSVCTIDGQKFSIGDFETSFCLQSTCKPLLYCMAQEEIGEEKVHKHVGLEPSGLGFNELSLDRNNLPHNPMINAGAIMCSSLLKPDLNSADRFDYVMNVLKELAGGQNPQFNNAVYLSERQTADRNFALAYFMRENKAFPENVDLRETLEFYFQCCSIEMDARGMAVMAATLANAGICPVTEQRVFSDKTVQNCLSLMLSCGMYDYSGEFAFKIGLPAKSGVSGGLMVVIPDLMGICIWAPPLDKLGNSVKGVEFCHRLAKKYNIHKYDVLAGESPKRNLKSKKAEALFQGTIELIYSASSGDISEIQRLLAAGTDLNQGDYDMRTALHLASAEGHLNVVKFLIEHGVEINPRDRWGGTPLADAQKHNHQEVIDFLKEKGAI